MAGLNIAVAVGATLLAFVGVIALLNGLLGWAGDLVGLELSFQIILGWLFAPSPGSSASPGIRPRRLVPDRHQDRHQRVRRLHCPGAGSDLERSSKAIVTFALCGFANISSMAILIGGWGHGAGRKSFIARYGMRAILAGVLANLMSASWQACSRPLIDPGSQHLLVIARFGGLFAPGCGQKSASGEAGKRTDWKRHGCHLNEG